MKQVDNITHIQHLEGVTQTRWHWTCAGDNYPVMWEGYTPLAGGQVRPCNSQREVGRAHPLPTRGVRKFKSPLTPFLLDTRALFHGDLQQRLGWGHCPLRTAPRGTGAQGNSPGYASPLPGPQHGSDHRAQMPAAGGFAQGARVQPVSPGPTQAGRIPQRPPADQRSVYRTRAAAGARPTPSP